MDENQLKELLRKYEQGLCTADEKALVETWYLQDNDSHTAELTEQVIEEDLSIIYEALPKPAKVRPLWPRIAAAASIVLAISFGGYFLFHKSAVPLTAQLQAHDVMPGRNQATLTLASGQQIILTKGLSGKLAQQGNTIISVNAGKSIAYEATNTGANTTVQYNTLATVRGEESPYPLILADGTKAWLNAASSITFPTAFNDRDRVVKITGEVYFEVAHNEKLPFKVEAKGQIIEDIGTVFNVNAYADEPATKTTLISGSIAINHKILKPGQEGVGEGVIIKNIDAENAAAWKNGYFLFDHESLESIMRKISRWYDVDVEYEPGQKFTDGFLGSMTRYTNVSQVLGVLESAGHVKFKVTGKKIIVTKK